MSARNEFSSAKYEKREMERGKVNVTIMKYVVSQG